MMLAINADPDKYGYNIGFDPHLNLSINGKWCKKSIIFYVDNR